VSEEDFADADALSVGAFGEPGRRVFLLQARRGTRVLTLKIEKGQAAQLATHFGRVLADRPASDTPPSAENALMTDDLEPAWAVGAAELGYDQSSGQIVLVLTEFSAEEDEESGPVSAEPASVRVTIGLDQAAAFIAAVEQLLAAGRPPCPLCGYPLDPSGHVCPKSNGHRPPTL
jgi:uncharacterized repeat protein (TIGR03847 family)